MKNYLPEKNLSLKLEKIKQKESKRVIVP